MADKTVVLVAGGSGSRMYSIIPKQFHLLDGKPVLFHTMEQFRKADKKIKLILVLPKNHLTSWAELIKRYEFSMPHTVVPGGETRFHSVKNGLMSIKGDGLVAIHDGVRPLVSSTLINKLFVEAAKHGSAIPVIPIPDSMRKLESRKSSPVDRAKYRLVQTPQCFKLDVIRDAFRQEYNVAFTDEATVAESEGHLMNLVQGEVANIKITTQEDLLFAESYLKKIQENAQAEE